MILRGFPGSLTPAYCPSRAVNDPDTGPKLICWLPPPAVTLTGIIHHIKERLIIMKIQIVWVPFRKKPQPGRLLIPP